MDRWITTTTLEGYEVRRSGKSSFDLVRPGLKTHYVRLLLLLFLLLLLLFLLIISRS